jgi:hypothetical protein
MTLALSISDATIWSIIYNLRFTIVNFYSTGHWTEFSTLEMGVH